MESTAGDARASLSSIRQVGTSPETTRPAKAAVGGRLALLQTKLAPPIHATGLTPLVRARLLTKIREAAPARVIVVSAPAGYGKTTLAAQLAAAAGGAWLSLDQRDNDPERFIAYLVGTLVQAGVTTGAAISQRLRLVADDGIWVILEQLLNDLDPAGEPITLILDDYHRIENAEVHQLVGYLIEFMPSTLRLLLISRTPPPLALARLRAEGALLEITADDLRFSREEAGSYLTMDDGDQLPLAEIARAHERTEGWIAALQLLKGLLHGKSDEHRREILREFGGTSRHVADLLIDEVLSRWPHHRDFLLQTSILARLTGPLCDAVTGQTDGAAVLQALEQDGSLLFALDDERRWYRYHHFLAELLRRQLTDSLDEAAIAALHHRAGAWLAAHDQTDEAVEHALAIADWPRAIDLLNEIGLEAAAYRDTLQLRRWLEALPADLRLADPALEYWYGRTLSSTCQPQAGRAYLERAEEDWRGAGSEQLLGSVRMGRAWSAMHEGRNDEAVELARSSIMLNADAPVEAQAMSLYTLGAAQLRLGQIREAMVMMAQATAKHPLPQISGVEIGRVLALSGRLAEAEREIRRGLSNGNLTDSHRRGRIWLAEIYLAWNELERADEQLTQAAELADMFEARSFFPSVEIERARLAWARGLADVAFDSLTAASERAADFASADIARVIALVRAGYWLDLGRVAEVGAWCYQAGLDPGIQPDFWRQEELLVYARFLAATGSPGAALVTLEELQRLAEEDGRVVDTARILIVQARTKLVRNLPDEARGLLSQAVSLLEPSDHIRAFADEGTALLEPLQAIAARGAHLDYVGRILEAIRNRPLPNVETAGGAKFALSPRELEVLRLVAVGLSNREIADQLFISVPTVKRHISTIFAKLGAANRVQAVNTARTHHVI